MANGWHASGVALALILAACVPQSGDGPQVASLAGALRTAAPPADAPGCWHGEERPALFETVTDQRVSADGRVERVQRQVLVRDRVAVWFEVPCEPVTPAFAASLQRALKARGLYAGPVTGRIDAATAEAVRRFQAARGLESATLSLAAARMLGLVAAAPG
jgi:hypothetical protein